MEKREGIYPILYSFWNKDGCFDKAAMNRQVDYCLDAGAHGIAVLGLVSEINKMSREERLEMVGIVSDRIAGRVPLAVTIGEPSIFGQIDFARQAKALGANWIILQPPAIRGTTQEDAIHFMGAVAEALDIQVAVQNNPVMEVSLSVDSLVELNRRHPNISILKGEGYSIDIQRVIERTNGALSVFGGHGGIEFPALLRSGGVGLIPAPDYLPAQVALFNAWKAGSLDRMEAIHRAILPTIVFMSRSGPGTVCYGKRLFALKAGIDVVVDREPAMKPTTFGLDEIRRFAAELDLAATL